MARLVYLGCLLLVFSVLKCEGKTMVFGGGTLDEDNAEVFNKIVQLAGGRGVARIGVISAGYHAPVTAGRKYVTLFETVYGAAEAYWVPVRVTDPDQAYNPIVVENVRRMTGFFYTGGNQPNVIGTLLNANRADTPVMAAIRERYEEGAVVSGSSGGALVQPGCITVIGGWSYQAIKYGASREDENVGRRDLQYSHLGGLGFINSHVVDAHFSERGREGRLIRLLSDTQDKTLGTSRGFGVDENTILVVDDVDGPNQTGTVVGYHGVVFVDVSNSEADIINSNWQIRGAKLDYLTAGDEIDLTNHDVTFSPLKAKVIGNEERVSAASSSDVFIGAAKGFRSEFRKVAETLFDSRMDSVNYGTTAESSPTYMVIMTQQVTSDARRDTDGNISYSDMTVDIRPL